MITLEPLGGLANRMRVIASGLWLMKESNQELEVIWNLNEEVLGSCLKTHRRHKVFKNPVFIQFLAYFFNSTYST